MNRCIDQQVHSYPESDNALNVIKANKNSIFLYSVNSEEGIVRGFALDLVKKGLCFTRFDFIVKWLFNFSYAF
jgi:hypothetical protein